MSLPHSDPDARWWLFCPDNKKMYPRGYTEKSEALLASTRLRETLGQTWWVTPVGPTRKDVVSTLQLEGT